MTRPAIADLVFAAAPPPAPRRGLAVALALAIHAALALAILNSQPSLEAWSAELAARVHDELTRLELAEVEDLKPPPPPSEPAPREAPAAEPSPVPAAARPAPRPAPARAARVVAAPPGALDLTGDVVVTGHASAYAGGVTTSTGTSAAPVASVGPPPPQPGPPAQAPPPPPRDRSRPVGLAGDEWNCPWPTSAEDLALDEQIAVLRVVVGPDGAVESAELVEDPGHGFGAAALACARRTRFTPARDAAGHEVRARSPAIRVHFYRDR